MKKTCVFLDTPEPQTVGVAAIYSVVCFFSFPFILLLLLGGFEGNSVAISWYEIVFHGINFCVVFPLFKEYLRDSFTAVQCDTKGFWKTVLWATLLMLGVVYLWNQLLPATQHDAFYIAAYGTIPITEMDLFSLSGNIVCANPLFMTVCMVLLTPITTSCLYYGIGFTHAHNVHPALGYLAVAAVTAFPRLCNAVTYWNPTEELILYLAHLPVHMIACWAYHRTDSILTPIAVHMISNLVACLLLIAVFVL